MTALEDRRPVAATTTTSAHPAVIGQGLVQLLLEHPGIELASIRLIPSTEHEGVGIVGRVGPLAPVCDCYPYGVSPAAFEGAQHHCPVHGHGNNLDPAECPACTRNRTAVGECPSCHTHDGHPHTDYCHALDSEVAGLNGWMWHQDGPDDAHPRHECDPTKCGWTRAEQRPADDPAPTPTCNGRNCGGHPHA